MNICSLAQSGMNHLLLIGLDTLQLITFSLSDVLSDSVGRSIYVSIINKHGPTGVRIFHNTNIMCMQAWCALKHKVLQSSSL